METDSEPITFTYNCTAKERREGQSLTDAPVKGSKRRKTAKNGTAGFVGWLLFVGAAIVLFAWFKFNQPAQGLKPAIHGVPAQFIDDTELHPELLVASSGMVVGGVVFLILGVTLATILNRRVTSRRNAALQMSILPDGLMESRLGVSTTTRWQSFRGAEEGSSVLILRRDDLQSVIIPKRLLGTNVAQVFEMLKARTTKTALPVNSAFPVVQP